ncbi:class I SAM-dependent methyltransferase [Neobacillus dielmonensis]|uniref:class I SAM-dependent methyltransferase n=1 Tax=Neobacillus dielmonensis TaxID=1347369 RepID=UPI0005A908C1|nr:class I SAM-dependent methyltransferase [Neobacillus dielmonensis]
MDTLDFGQVANSYARSREDIPISLMESLLFRNIYFDGKKVADLGAGTGALTRKIAMRKADVVGIEPSPELIKHAMAFNHTKNFTIPYLPATAEQTGLADSEFDIVTVMRAWHWFDRAKAIKEIKRILKPNGKLIVVDSGFLTEHELVQQSLAVVSKYAAGGLRPAGSKADANQRINGFPVEWFVEWQQSGFDLTDFYKLNYTVRFTKQEWVHRIRSISWLAAMEENVREQAMKELLDTLPDQEPYDVPHECNVCILRYK